MHTFVLVHGAWHDGASWEEVMRELQNRGHKAYNPTIAGNGMGADTKVTHAQCTQSIVDYIVASDLTDIILVGHSYGGTIIAKTAEKIPGRIRRLVFWNAFVLNDGECLNDAAPPHYKALFDEQVRSSPDGTVMLPFPVWREAFINDGDLELATETYARLSPQPYLPFCEKLDMKTFYSLQIPKSYINCTEDVALPHGEWCWHPRMSSRLGLFRLVQMPGSHEVIFSNPRGLAEKIIEAGRD